MTETLYDNRIYEKAKDLVDNGPLPSLGHIADEECVVCGKEIAHHLPESSKKVIRERIGEQRGVELYRYMVDVVSRYESE